MSEQFEDLWERLPPGMHPHAFERRRAFLLERLSGNDRVLDVGCGDGSFCAELRKAGARPVGIEVAWAAVQRARERHPGLTFERVTPYGPWPFDTAAFDVVWASEVIEHVADTARWLSEVRRVLRSGGRLLVTTPSHGRLRRVAIAAVGFEEHFDPLGQHLRFYSRRSLAEVLDQFGFDEVRVTEAGGPPLLREMLLAQARRRRF